ncbi:uncharacterized protein BX663DRAFT_581007 [Cokeromyces recurvatus]|uniref:uncharacterized protein n=1 Tax=Cokeromyces recurvatus TaxID=90255 RepID=UPI00222023E7|nr:uncharacterized protein BX663DRAFT_581007 [Cokeromyces recurvatus]KAI7905915.1 hypothetical protein BX663DRAFT_581007 [Cokeromyces recurvatus]
MEGVANLVKRATNQQMMYNKYTSEQKLVYYKRVKLYSATKSGSLASGITERTAQRWIRKLKEDKD